MNHLEWKESNPSLPGPVTYYGYWEGAKCFSVYYSPAPSNPGFPYRIKSALPGFRPDLPSQSTVDGAKDFAERMLQRWAAKRGLLFKSHIVVTDAMRKAMREVANNSGDHTLSENDLEYMFAAAINARK